MLLRLALIFLLPIGTAGGTVLSFTGTLSEAGAPPINRFVVATNVDSPDVVLTPTNPSVFASIPFESGLAIRLEDTDQVGESISLQYRSVNNSAETIFIQHHFGFLDQNGDIIQSFGLRQHGFPLERPPGQQTTQFLNIQRASRHFPRSRSTE